MGRITGIMKKITGKRNIILCLVLLMVVCVNSIAVPQELTKSKLLKKGIYYFRQEGYDEALNIFKQVLSQEGESSIVDYYIGLTYKRMENYVKGKEYLINSLNMTPRISGALIELIDILYRLGQYDQAKQWINIAKEEGVRPAQARFLEGLTLQKTGDYEGSVKAFEDAKGLDDRLAQSATYQIGMCRLKMKDYKDARSAFEDVFTLDPYSKIGSYANKYVESLDRRIKSMRPFHFSARSSIEYDSNVILQPTDTSLLTNVTDKNDWRGVFDIKSDYTFRSADNTLSLKTGYGLRVSEQRDLKNYDYVGNNFSLQGNASLKKMLFSVPVNFSHTIVDGKNYLASASVGNVESFMIGKTNLLQMGIVYTGNDYLREPIIAAENRDGSELSESAGWFWFFEGNKGFVNAKYSFAKDWTKGDNWKFSGHRMDAGVLYPFLEKFKLGINGEMYIQNFDNIHTVFLKKRKDRTYTLNALLTYEIIKNLELQLSYTFVNAHSNLALYDYNRHVCSAGIQFKY